MQPKKSQALKVSTKMVYYPLPNTFISQIFNHNQCHFQKLDENLDTTSLLLTMLEKLGEDDRKPQIDNKVDGKA